MKFQGLSPRQSLYVIQKQANPMVPYKSFTYKLTSIFNRYIVDCMSLEKNGTKLLHELLMNAFDRTLIK